MLTLNKTRIAEMSEMKGILEKIGNKIKGIYFDGTAILLEEFKSYGANPIIPHSAHLDIVSL